MSLTAARCGPKRVIYFDHNASSPMLPEARECWLSAVDLYIGNPSSPHRLGARAEMALTQARERLGAFLGCSPFEIVFTSSATESNNAIFSNLLRTANGKEIWVSSIDHPSVLAPARSYFRDRVRFIPVLPDGQVDVDWIAAELKKSQPAAIFLMAANNETGVLQPWIEAAAIARQYGVVFACDATQWLGKLPASGLGLCDFLTGSAHKFGGPRGVGFLKVPAAGKFHPLLLGGSQEEARRAGTENVAGILSMVRALEVREERLHVSRQLPMAEEKEVFEQRLLSTLPGTVIVGRSTQRLWNTTMALMSPSDCQQRWVVKLDKLGFAVSTGSACASGKEEPSHVLRAMGLSPEQASRALRFSSGWETTATDWAALGEALQKVVHTMARVER